MSPLFAGSTFGYAAPALVFLFGWVLRRVRRPWHGYRARGFAAVIGAAALVAFATAQRPLFGILAACVAVLSAVASS